jgi:hypothetical protein
MKHVKIGDNYYINLDQIAFIRREGQAIEVYFCGVEEVLRLEGETAKKLLAVIAQTQDFRSA